MGERERWVPDRPWKAFERKAAGLFGGVRHWANSGERLDFESATALGQCKLVQRLSLTELTKLAEEMERESLLRPVPKAGVVVVKLRAGSGKKTPLLVVMTEKIWAQIAGQPEEEPA